MISADSLFESTRPLEPSSQKKDSFGFRTALNWVAASVGLSSPANGNAPGTAGRDRSGSSDLSLDGASCPKRSDTGRRRRQNASKKPPRRRPTKKMSMLESKGWEVFDPPFRARAQHAYDPDTHAPKRGRNSKRENKTRHLRFSAGDELRVTAQARGWYMGELMVEHEMNENAKARGTFPQTFVEILGRISNEHDTSTSRQPASLASTKPGRHRVDFEGLAVLVKHARGEERHMGPRNNDNKNRWYPYSEDGDEVDASWHPQPPLITPFPVGDKRRLRAARNLHYKGVSGLKRMRPVLRLGKSKSLDSYDVNPRRVEDQSRGAAGVVPVTSCSEQGAMTVALPQLENERPLHRTRSGSKSNKNLRGYQDQIKENLRARGALVSSWRDILDHTSDGASSGAPGPSRADMLSSRQYQGSRRGGSRRNTTNHNASEVSQLSRKRQAASKNPALLDRKAQSAGHLRKGRATSARVSDSHFTTRVDVDDKVAECHGSIAHLQLSRNEDDDTDDVGSTTRPVVLRKNRRLSLLKHRDSLQNLRSSSEGIHDTTSSAPPNNDVGKSVSTGDIDDDEGFSTPEYPPDRAESFSARPSPADASLT